MPGLPAAPRENKEVPHRALSIHVAAVATAAATSTSEASTLYVACQSPPRPPRLHCARNSRLPPPPLHTPPTSAAHKQVRRCRSFFARCPGQSVSGVMVGRSVGLTGDRSVPCLAAGKRQPYEPVLSAKPACTSTAAAATAILAAAAAVLLAAAATMILAAATTMLLLLLALCCFCCYCVPAAATVLLARRGGQSFQGGQDQLPKLAD